MPHIIQKETDIKINKFRLGATRLRMYVRRNIVACSSNYCRRGKARSVTNCKCVPVALSSRHANSIFMLSIMLSSTACLALLHFSALSHKSQVF